jgi:predicted CopG family antitoxin
MCRDIVCSYLSKKRKANDVVGSKDGKKMNQEIEEWWGFEKEKEKLLCLCTDRCWQEINQSEEEVSGDR